MLINWNCGKPFRSLYPLYAENHNPANPAHSELKAYICEYITTILNSEAIKFDLMLQSEIVLRNKLKVT